MLNSKDIRSYYDCARKSQKGPVQVVLIGTESEVMCAISGQHLTRKMYRMFKAYINCFNWNETIVGRIYINDKIYAHIKRRAE